MIENQEFHRFKHQLRPLREYWKMLTLRQPQPLWPWHNSTITDQIPIGSRTLCVYQTSSLIVSCGADCQWLEQDPLSEGEALRRPRMHSSVELPPIHNHMNQEPIPPFHSPRPRELLPSIMPRSPPGRSSTLPPIQKRDKPTRPRKSSITKNNRRPKHERGMSKEYARRLSIEGRKAFSAEPASAMGKRWEDLIEAATSANEADSDRDLTPVSSRLSPR